MAEKMSAWIVIVRGHAEGKEVRVALEFQDAEAIMSPSSHRVGVAFIDKLLSLFHLHDNWLIKTIIEEVRTPEETPLVPTSPLFALLSRSRSRGLSAGALFIAKPEPSNTRTENSLAQQDENYALLTTPSHYLVAGISPIGFAAACSDDSRLFTRFITRLLKRPEAFSDVSLLLPLQITKPNSQ